MKRKSILDIKRSKESSKPIVCLTAYDFGQARLCDEAGVDLILVGDSMNNVVYGEPDTLSITVQDMIRPVKAVVQGSAQALVIADMPFMSYQSDDATGLQNAARFMKECGAQGVKLEGGAECAPLIRKLVWAGIPVMAHIGLTPQRVHAMGGYRMHGKTREEGELLKKDALAVQDAGAFSVVLECVDAALSQELTKLLHIPTIGIGSGTATNGQILVYHDLLGLTEGHTPKFVEPTGAFRKPMLDSIIHYVKRVRRET